jgi:hypothetical protein
MPDLESAMRTARPILAAFVVLVLMGCASGPPVGGTAWVGVDAVLTAADLQGHRGHSVRRNLDGARLAAAGVTEADIAAGRLLLVSCSPSIDATWSSFAIAPPGVVARRGEVLQLQVREDSGNERLGLNRITGGIEPGLRDTMPAYRAIPDWRERGLSNNFERLPLPPALQGRYRIVQGSYVIAC